MWKLVGICVWGLACVTLAITWWRLRASERAWERLHTTDGTSASGTNALAPTRRLRRLRRSWWWLAWCLGLLVVALVRWVIGWPWEYAVAIGLVVALLLGQVEAMWVAQREALLENQLADGIDIMVGALGAGASINVALEAVITETASPLRPFLEDMSGRIRLGDDPNEVFRALADQVPLETFLLFSSALSVHWEVGGRLAPTLATVGRTIRDRIEIARRIRSNIAQSQFSTFAIIGLIYLIAVIVWRNGPDQMSDFVTSRVGSVFVAGSIIAQAVGIFWMNLISKPKF